MLSRVANTIYWMARYMERTGGMLQVSRTQYISSQDDLKDFTWTPLINAFGGSVPKEELKELEKDSSKVFHYLILDKENETSAFNNIMKARENARAIQDHITIEVWQCLNNYYHFIRGTEFEELLETGGDPVTAIDILLRHGLQYTGTIKNTMTRDESYTFLHIGKFLERAIIITDILRMEVSKFDLDIEQSLEPRGLKYLLYSLLGYEIYMKTYNGHFSSKQVLELVIHNTFFPHSLIYCLYQVNKYFERLKSESLPESYAQLEFLIGKTMNNIKYSNLQVNNKVMLDEFLLQTKKELIEISRSFSKYYFGNS